MTKEIVKETLAYSVEEFASYTGYGRTTIDEAIARGELSPVYANKKGVIPIEEGKRWVRSLSTERPTKVAR